ncbi:hypothetical protein DB35_12750 [Streptomyces abyssalis]|uniref:PepSY domain-containing protein n=1 Tax=Streptomyces abyssalis TaxID=933944 RepID=A0A1E7JGZ4_9ACTN|nr:PepSY domain-containing protein [Streptomyces abyssalis]OEU85733.1 hypothetical protein AN215_25195 [Streptomyces abyssalis]OEU92802.1 hypothetical protein DB35_12750 [Streptomyces abyssalis]
MKRKLAIATITAAALVGTGTVSAVAMADDGAQKSAQVASAPHSADDRDDRDDRNDKDDRDDDRDDRDDRDDKDDRAEDARDGKDDDVAPAGLKVSAADAASKAASKGTVTSVDLDDDRNNRVWEVETTDKSGKQQDFLVDADSGKLTQQTADDDRDGERSDDDRDDRNDKDDRDDRDDDGRADD